MFIVECNKQFKFSFGTTEVLGSEKRVNGEVTTKGKMAYLKVACFTMCWFDECASSTLFSILRNISNVNSSVALRIKAKSALLGSSTQLCISEQQFKREIVDWMYANDLPFLSHDLLKTCANLAFTSTSKVREEHREYRVLMEDRLTVKNREIAELRRELHNIEQSIVKLSKLDTDSQTTQRGEQ